MEFFIGIIIAFMPSGETAYISADFPDRATCEAVTTEFVRRSLLEMPVGAEMRFDCVSSDEIKRRLD